MYSRNFEPDTIFPSEEAFVTAVFEAPQNMFSIQSRLLAGELLLRAMNNRPHETPDAGQQ